MVRTDLVNGTRSPHWNKIPVIQKHLARADVDFVFWMDADSIFMNMDTPLDDFIVPGKDLVFSCDTNCWVFLNNGHMMIRNTPWSKSTLEEWWNTYPPPGPESWYDQSALYFILSGKREECRDSVESRICSAMMGPQESFHCDALDQKAMNAYVQDYRPGDFILHFAGINWVTLPGKTPSYVKHILMQIYDRQEVPLLNRAVEVYKEYMRSR